MMSGYYDHESSLLSSLNSRLLETLLHITSSDFRRVEFCRSGIGVVMQNVLAIMDISTLEDFIPIALILIYQIFQCCYKFTSVENSMAPNYVDYGSFLSFNDL
jgi:hypothetical protein